MSLTFASRLATPNEKGAFVGTLPVKPAPSSALSVVSRLQLTQHAEQLLQVAALRIVGTLLEILADPDRRRAGLADAGEDQAQVALKMQLVGPEQQLELQHGRHIRVVAGGGVDLEQVL